jgi:hypothetical protein
MESVETGPMTSVEEDGETTSSSTIAQRMPGPMVGTWSLLPRERAMEVSSYSLLIVDLTFLTPLRS